MKYILIISLIVFNYFSLVKADDIRDFKIEDVGIGDSLLKKYSITEIKNFYKAEYYSDNKYTTIDSIELPNDSKYDYISFSYKSDDKKYHIVGLVADIDSKKSFNNNIDKCYPLKDEIVNELKNLFTKSNQQDNGTFSHPIDKSGKSKITNYAFYLTNDSSISVSCYDYASETGYADSLRVGLITKEFNEWLTNKAYK